MKETMLRTLIVRIATAALLAAASSLPLAAQSQSFTIGGGRFLLDGKPFRILSGEMHYARIPRAYWRARMEMAKAMGLNTIATYVFWNVHEPEPGVWNFTGNADLPEFLREARQEGLYVILRAGPYSCAEWEFGGFPAWLLADPKMETALRSNDPAFMAPAERWLMRLGQEVAQYQIGRGGPIIAVQMENEYGDFGADQQYLKHLREIFLKAGFTDALLFTHILGEPALAESNCPTTSTPIRIELTPSSVVSLDPGGAVVSQLFDRSLLADIRHNVCDHGHFFASAEAASEWVSEHPDGRVLAVADAFEQSRRDVEKLGWLPQPARTR